MKARATLRRAMRKLGDLQHAVITLVVEKEETKRKGLKAKLVLSMTRMSVAGFTAVGLYRFLVYGINGWPEATLDMSTVLALPLLGALKRTRPEDVVELAKTVVGRFGIGDVPHLATAFAGAGREPSKFDDHRMD